MKKKKAKKSGSNNTKQQQQQQQSSAKGVTWYDPPLFPRSPKAAGDKSTIIKSILPEVLWYRTVILELLPLE
jgi:hypothetical protein